MADIIPPGFAQVTVPLRNAAVTRPAAVVFGVEVPSGGVDPDTFAGSIQSLLIARFGPRIDNAVTIGPTRVAVGQDGGEPVMGTAPTDAGGNGALNSVPPNVAVLLRKRTTRGGRRGQGRMYLPWAVDEGSVSESGALTGPTIDAWNLAGSGLLSDLAAADSAMVLLHSVGQTLPGSPNVVTSLTCDGLVATQRRRLSRR